MFNGAAIGRAADWTSGYFGGAVEKLDGGVVLSVGSGDHGAQVFEKSLSCVTTCACRPDGKSFTTRDFCGGPPGRRNWGLAKGSAQRQTGPNYLRFCKSFSPWAAR